VKRQLAPAELTEGKAPTNGLDPANVRCNTDATVEAVQFRLIKVNQLRYADLDPADPQYRNRLAYRFFASSRASRATPTRGATTRRRTVCSTRCAGRA